MASAGACGWRPPNIEERHSGDTEQDNRHGTNQPEEDKMEEHVPPDSGFVLRSVIVVFVLPLGQQHSSIRIAVVTPTPQLQVEEPRRPAAHDERDTGGQTYNYKCPKVPQFSEKFTSGIALSSEHGADMVKPAVYPFECRE